MHETVVEGGTDPGVTARGWPTSVSVRTVAWFLERMPLLEAENEALRGHAHDLEARARHVGARAEALEREVRDLRARLAFYENPNTPPSQRRLPSGPTGTAPEVAGPRRRGAPVGHRGATYVPRPPDEVVGVTARACPKCGLAADAPASVEARTITELPPPQPARVTRYDVGSYGCTGCGHAYAATHPGLPRRGQWGPNLLTYMTMLKYHVRGPVRRVAGFLAHREGLAISPKGVHDALLRAAEACQVEYARIALRVRDAPFLNADETTIKVNGEPRWLWCFRTPDGEVLTVIRDSRARDGSA